MEYSTLCHMLMLYLSRLISKRAVLIRRNDYSSGMKLSASTIMKCSRLKLTSSSSLALYCEIYTILIHKITLVCSVILNNLIFNSASKPRQWFGNRQSHNARISCHCQWQLHLIFSWRMSNAILYSSALPICRMMSLW